MDVFDGTPAINFIYRLYGANIGADVFLYGVTIMEFDLVTVDDGAILANAVLQTHLYEDRVLKHGRVYIGKGALMGNQSYTLCVLSFSRTRTTACYF